MKNKGIARVTALLLLLALLLSTIPLTGMASATAAETLAEETVSQETQLSEPDETDAMVPAEETATEPQETEAPETREGSDEPAETEANIPAEEAEEDLSWMDAGLLLLVNGTLVPYNPASGEANPDAVAGNRAIPSSIYYSDVLGAHGSDLNGTYIKSGGLYDSWVYGNNQWWPYSTGVLSPYTNKRVRTDMLYCNDGPSHYKTESGVLAIPIRPSQESGWSMDVSGYGNYTTRSTGVPTYKSESLYTKMVPNYSAATWTQINLIYGVAKGMGGMTESGNTNITAAASTLITNVVFGYIGLGSDGAFRGKPVMTSNTAVNTQMLEILVRCEVYSKEKGLTGSASGDNTVSAIKAKGYSATDTTGWYVASGTAASTAMGYFQINKSQSNGNQIYIFATNEITFDNGKKISLKKTTQGGADVTACIQNNPLYTLEGAVYEIHQGSATGTVVETLTTNANGEATGTKTYAIGTKLYAVEKTAPSGYLLNTSPVELTVSSGSNVFNVSDRPTFDPNNLVITKTGSDSTRIAGAVFKAEFFASNWADSTKLLRTWYFQSDATGVVRLMEGNLAAGYTSDPLFKISGSVVIPLGCVLVTEVETATGYLLPQGNDAKVFLFIRQGGTKTAQMGQPAGAYWGNGSADPLNSETPKGIYQITNDADKTALTAVNEDVYGKPFKLQKTDPSNVPLAGAIFQVDYYNAGWFDQSKHEKTWYFQSDANGYFTLDSQHLAAGYTSDSLFPVDAIPLGIMRVKEIQAPEGFKSIDFTGVWRMKQTESGSASVDSYWAAGDGVTPTTSYGDAAYILDADPQKLYVKNEPLVDLEIIKICSDGVVKDITFTIERYEGGGVGWWTWKTLKTDVNGKIAIDGLEVGMRLRVTEVVPEGYICNSENPQTITLVAGTNTLRFENEPLADLEIIKTSEDGKVNNISFRIEKYEAEGGIGWWTWKTVKTDAGGKITLDGLKVGQRLRITEIVPENYICTSENPQIVTLVKGTNTVTFTNKPIVRLELLKTSDDGNVDGIEFTLAVLRDQAFVDIGTYTTHDGGKIEVEDLTEGTTYRLTETVPEGYVGETPAQEFTAQLGTNTVSFANHLIRGSLRIVKVDKGTETPLEGAGYRVFNAAGEEVASGYTDENGEVVFENLAYGEYTYQEFEAPSGFVLDDTVYSFSILEDGAEIIKQHDNQPKEGSITIYKTDEAGRPLPGVTFLLEASVDGGQTWSPIRFREAGSDVLAGYCTSQGLAADSLTTASDGYAVFSGLCIDTQMGEVKYRITETATRNGYSLLPGYAFEGSLSEDSEIEASFTVVNQPVFKMPATGSDGFTFMIIGLALVGLVGAIALIVIRRKARRDDGD